MINNFFVVVSDNSGHGLPLGTEVLKTYDPSFFLLQMKSKDAEEVSSYSVCFRKGHYDLSQLVIVHNDDIEDSGKPIEHDLVVGDYVFTKNARRFLKLHNLKQLHGAIMQLEMGILRKATEEEAANLRNNDLFF